MTDIFMLSEQAVEQAAAADPIAATEAGISGFGSKWTDFSPDGHAHRRDLAATLTAEAVQCNAADRREILAKRVLLEQCADTIASVDSGDHLSELRNIASPLQNIRDVFELMPTRTEQDWEDIATRLETIGTPLDGYRASLEEGRRTGRSAAPRQVEAAIRQADAAAGPGSSFEGLARETIDDPGLCLRLDNAVQTARLAYGEFASYLRDEYFETARATDPVGREAYQRAVRHHLGCDPDLEETYLWGWDEVHRLTAEFDAICRELQADAPRADVLDRLKTEPELAAGSIEEFVELMEARQELALNELDSEHFDIPEALHEVEVCIEASSGSLAPHYTGPAEDLSRPGIIWYPFEGRDFFPLYQEVTTAYHEGIPGHHLQIGTQVVEAANLTRFHRLFVWSPGSGEGWALYAEHLMSELGLLERAQYRAGYVASQLFRSCRIVIDIGLHLGLTIPAGADFHPGQEWSYELAREMLIDVGLQPPAFAESEAVRYLGWPGQAISYKYGERTIKELRKAAALQPDFDVREFHTEMLGLGAIGLDLLEEMVAT